MIVSELQYFPPITSVVALYRESYVLYDIYELYRKMSFRNRFIVAGARGAISLSVPLEEGRNQRLPINEVRISNVENWQSRHFKSLQSVYNRSPYFDHYKDELGLVFGERFDRLTDWNMFCLNWLKKILDWPAEIRLTEKQIPFNAEGFVDLRSKVVPKNYNQWYPAKYRQTFEERTGFIPNLSVLDLLFNEGPGAGELLRNSSVSL